jgi:hypothetical protein
MDGLQFSTWMLAEPARIVTTRTVVDPPRRTSEATGITTTGETHRAAFCPSRRA